MGVLKVVVCSILLLVSGCIAIPVDPSPEDFYAQNAKSRVRLRNLRFYRQRKLIVGFYPGLKAAVYHGMGDFELVTYGLVVTVANMAALVPTMVGILSEFAFDYGNDQLDRHGAWLSLIGYFKTYDPIIAEEDSSTFGAYRDEAYERLREGEDFLKVAADIEERSGLGVSKVVLLMYPIGERIRSLGLAGPGAGHYLKASRLDKNGRHVEAISEYQKAIEENPADPRYHTDYGVSLIQLGRFQEALASFNRALEVDGNYRPALQSRALLYSRLGRSEEAIKDFSRLLKKFPSAEVYTLRAVEYRKIGRIENAFADVDVALRHDSECGAAYYVCGLLHTDQGQLGPAVADFTEAIRLDKNLAEAYHNRATVYFRLGDSRAALKDFDRAIEIRPNPKSFFTRGLVYEKLADRSRAIENLTKAIELDPGFGRAYLYRAKLRILEGDKAGALSDMKKARDLGIPVDEKLIESLGSMLQPSKEQSQGKKN